jgi:hypothetical protein
VLFVTFVYNGGPRPAFSPHGLAEFPAPAAVTGGNLSAI